MFNPKLMLLNVQSIKKDKICDILLDINNFENIELIFLTELWESPDSINNVYIEGFTKVNSYCRETSIRGGRVGIFITRNM